MTIEEFREFANCLKNNYTIDFDKLSEFCDMALSLTQWIPVSERLPKSGEYVLASIKPEVSDYRVVISKFNNEAYWTDGTVEAWKPLPEPYKGGDS